MRKTKVRLMISIGGSPCAGKSSLMFNILKHYDYPKGWKRHKKGLVDYLCCTEHNLIILGRYGKEIDFPGTDQLSMAVQQEALDFIKNLEDGWKCVWEGDRLWNAKFLVDVYDLEDLETYFIELTARKSELKSRHLERQDTQSAKWLKSRETKLTNIRRAVDITTLPNNDVKEQELNLAYLVNVLNGFAKGD